MQFSNIESLMGSVHWVLKDINEDLDSATENDDAVLKIFYKGNEIFTVDIDNENKTIELPSIDIIRESIK